MRVALVLLLATSAGCEQRQVVNRHISDLMIVHQFSDIEQRPLRSATIVDDSTVAALFDPGIELLLVSPTGIIKRLGRAGGGPGEFRDARWVVLSDTAHLVVVDRASRLATRWLLDGAMDANVRIDEPYLSGLWMMHGDAVVRSHTLGSARVRFGRIDFTSSRVISWRDFPMDSGGQLSCMYCYAAVSANGMIAMTAPDTVYRISRWAETGQPLVPLSREGIPLVQLNQYELDSAKALRSRMLADAERAGIKRSELIGSISSMAVGRRKPRFATNATFVDAHGWTWTQRNVAQDSAPTVDVFDNAGLYCGNVLLPHRSKLLEVRLPLLLTVQYAEDGNERLEIFRTTPLVCSEKMPTLGKSLTLRAIKYPQ